MDKGTDSWSQRTTFVGFDWASDHHDAVVVDQHGKIIEDFRFDDTVEGWELLRSKLSKYPDPYRPDSTPHPPCWFLAGRILSPSS